MLEAVFISDLHLHPAESVILKRFESFIDWASKNTQSLYILGDFFHAWPGDDGMDAWSLSIAKQLNKLGEQGIPVYFMAGNRDFLLGKQFLNAAQMQLLTEPAIIRLGGMPVLLVHGDCFCTEDRAHQWFRKLTRNSWFPRLFLKLPFNLRHKLVAQVRKLSRGKQNKNWQKMNVVNKTLIEHMIYYQVSTVVHGHTHQPGLVEHQVGDEVFNQYVLSDWDDAPSLLCYDSSKSFHFIQFNC